MGSPLRRAVRRTRSVPAFERVEAAAGLARFHADRQRRLRRHPDLAHRHGLNEAVVEELRREGVATIPNVVPGDAVHSLRRELHACLGDGPSLNPASNDASRHPGDLTEATVFLSPDDLAQGEEHCRELTNHLSVKEPLLSCPTVVALGFSDLLLDIASSYLGCPPAVGGVNLRKSFVNGLPDFDTLHFHSDPNSPRFLKFFIYLNDVDDHGGPFCYVRCSHREKFRGWRAKYRWTPDEIEAIYEPSRIAYMTGRVGDLVIADTTGFHRGTKVRSADRSMLTVNYGVHPEFGGRVPRPKIDRGSYQKLDRRQQAAADLLEIVY